MALMLYTGQRRGDIVHMGRQHVRNGIIEVRQHKTGTPLTIPIHPSLQAILDATPSKHLPFLTTTHGKPFTSAASFGNWFGDCCRQAALPKGTAAHGFRKAADAAAARGPVLARPHAPEAAGGLQAGSLATSDACRFGSFGFDKLENTVAIPIESISHNSAKGLDIHKTTVP
jgi:hypothetical protein